jgi:hypothetical protein
MEEEGENLEPDVSLEIPWLLALWISL